MWKPVYEPTQKDIRPSLPLPFCCEKVSRTGALACTVSHEGKGHISGMAEELCYGPCLQRTTREAFKNCWNQRIHLRVIIGIFPDK